MNAEQHRFNSNFLLSVCIRVYLWLNKGEDK
jgi:hypothetical protein